MKTSQENLRVTFYLKRNVTRNGLCPVMGRITIGKGTLSAKERYDKLIKENPHYIQRLSNRVISTYLDISQETLSRLKSK